MGPAPSRNSTRVADTRSSHKSRRKPVPSNPHKLRAAADVRRDAEEQLRDKSRPSSEVMATRLVAPKPAANLGMAAVDALSEHRDCLPRAALRQIRRKLDIASAVAYVCAAALRGQAADDDIDVALCLQRCVGDALFGQIQHIDQLLGEHAGGDGGAS